MSFTGLQAWPFFFNKKFQIYTRNSERTFFFFLQLRNVCHYIKQKLLIGISGKEVNFSIKKLANWSLNKTNITNLNK